MSQMLQNVRAALRTALLGDDDVVAEVMRATGIDAAVARVEERRTRERDVLFERRNGLKGKLETARLKCRAAVNDARAAAEAFEKRVLDERKQFVAAVQAAELGRNQTLRPLEEELTVITASLKGYTSANSSNASARISGYLARLNDLPNEVLIPGIERIKGEPYEGEPAERHVLLENDRGHARHILLELIEKAKELDLQANLEPKEFASRLRELTAAADRVALRYGRWVQLPSTDSRNPGMIWKVQGEVFYDVSGEPVDVDENRLAVTN